MVDSKQKAPVTKNTITSDGLDPSFKNEVAAEPGGENIKVCFACGTCTASCPIAEIDSRYDPRRIIHQILLGMRDQVLSDPVIWHCYLCYRCYARCPQNVKFTNIMEAVRRIAVREGRMPESLQKGVAFLDEASRRSRVSAVETLCGLCAEGKGELSERELLDKLEQAVKQMKDGLK